MTWSDPENPDRVTKDQISFLIRFELGQAPPFLFVDARSKDRSKRERALEGLTERIAVRFAPYEILKTGKPAGNHG